MHMHQNTYTHTNADTFSRARRRTPSRDSSIYDILEPPLLLLPVMASQGTILTRLLVFQDEPEAE